MASYIPELTRADASWFGISIATVDGHVYQTGESRQPFTIQTISKAITYGLALEDRGLDFVLSKVGVEPSGEAFNSISLEPETGRPLNPMTNAGAIATTAMITANEDTQPLRRMLEAFGRYTGRTMKIDETVNAARSTSATVLRQVHGCAQVPSRRRRDPAQREVLGACADRIRVYELQGELLFGSAESVTLEMLTAVSEVDYLVVDLKRVVAVDGASIRILGKLYSRIAAEGRLLFFTDCRHLYQFRRTLEKRLEDAQEPGWLRFEDADHAVEWCEDQLLAEARTEAADGSAALDLSQQYLCVGLEPDEIETMRQAGRERTFVAGTMLFRAGEPGESLLHPPRRGRGVDRHGFRPAHAAHNPGSGHGVRGDRATEPDAAHGKRRGEQRPGLS